MQHTSKDAWRTAAERGQRPLRNASGVVPGSIPAESSIFPAIASVSLDFLLPKTVDNWPTTVLQAVPIYSLKVEAFQTTSVEFEAFKI